MVGTVPQASSKPTASLSNSEGGSTDSVFCLPFRYPASVAKIWDKAHFMWHCNTAHLGRSALRQIWCMLHFCRDGVTNCCLGLRFRLPTLLGCDNRNFPAGLYYDPARWTVFCPDDRYTHNPVSIPHTIFLFQFSCTIIDLCLHPEARVRRAKGLLNKASPYLTDTYIHHI